MVANEIECVIIYMAFLNYTFTDLVIGAKWW